VLASWSAQRLKMMLSIPPFFAMSCMALQASGKPAAPTMTKHCIVVAVMPMLITNKREKPSIDSTSDTRRDSMTLGL